MEFHVSDVALITVVLYFTFLWIRPPETSFPIQPHESLAHFFDRYSSAVRKASIDRGEHHLLDTESEGETPHLAFWDLLRLLGWKLLVSTELLCENEVFVSGVRKLWTFLRKCYRRCTEHAVCDSGQSGPDQAQSPTSAVPNPHVETMAAAVGPVVAAAPVPGAAAPVAAGGIQPGDFVHVHRQVAGGIERDKVMLVARIPGMREWVVRTTDISGATFIYAILRLTLGAFELPVATGAVPPRQEAPGVDPGSINWIMTPPGLIAQWDPAPAEVVRISTEASLVADMVVHAGLPHGYVVMVALGNLQFMPLSAAAAPAAPAAAPAALVPAGLSPAGGAAMVAAPAVGAGAGPAGAALGLGGAGPAASSGASI